MKLASQHFVGLTALLIRQYITYEYFHRISRNDKEVNRINANFAWSIWRKLSFRRHNIVHNLSKIQDAIWYTITI